MAGYDNFPGVKSGIQVAVIAGGHKGDSAEDHSGNQKLFSPLEHKDGDVSLDDLWFSTISQSPTQLSQQSFNGVLDPGTLVYVLKGIGESGGIILGQSNGILNGGAGGGGGGSALGAETLKKLQQTDIGVRTPPKVTETEERGVRIRKVQETGDLHSLSMLDGLPLHGALFDLTGFKLPEIKQIPTAKQTNDEMMNPEMLQNMLGQVMTLGQMFKGMMGNKGGGAGGFGSMPNSGVNPGIAPNGNTHFDNVMSVLPDNMQRALRSTSNLVQGLETNEGITFVTGGVVHEPTYYANAAELLSQITSIDDMMYVLQRLQWDTSLFGQEFLEGQTYTLNTAFGVITQYIDFNGDITVDYDANVANAIAEWDNTLSDANNSPGIGSGTTPPPSSGGGSGGSGGAGNIGQITSMMQQMFGKSSSVMKDMFKRLTPEGEKEAKQMHEKLNKDEKSKKMWSIVTKTTEGGDPLEKNNYDKGSTGAGQ